MPKLGAILLAILLVPFAATAAADNPQPCSTASTKGESCRCELAKLHPTQIGLGELHMQQIATDSPKKLQKHAAKDPASILIGPDSTYYIFDGHHHARAMLEQVGKVSDAQPTTICKIEEDDRLIAPFGSADMFWRWMVVNHHARLAGGDASSGRSSPGVYPPPSLKDMQNDAYRSLASFMEDPCGIDMSGDYAQFAWADFLRAQHIPAPTTLDGHKEQGRKAGEAVLSMAKSDPNIRAAMHPLPGGDAFLAESCKEKPKQPK